MQLELRNETVIGRRLPIQLALPGLSLNEGLAQSLEWVYQVLSCTAETRKMHHDHGRYLMAFFGDVSVKSIGYPEIRSYAKSELLRGMARETVRKRITTLKMALQEAVYHRVLERLPDIPTIKGESHPKEGYWTYLQWEAVNLACDVDDDLRMWIAVDWWCGSHSSDINRFRWQDVDLVSKTWVRRNTKVKAKPIVLPLPDRLCAILKERFERVQPHPRDLVCGRIIKNPNREIKALARRAGVPEISPIEAGRHSCETYLEECGTTELYQMTWLGLKSPAMLKKHYRHQTARGMVEGIARVNAHV